MFDIQPTDDFGNVLAITKTVRVILPIDAGKTVAQVFYLPENGQPQSLVFEEISRTVAGQTLKFVIFDTEHFSQYGIIYAKEAAQSSDMVTLLTFAGVLSLASIALLELKRHKKSE